MKRYVVYLLNSFARSVGGNVATIFGLLLPMLLVTAGVSIDYIRAYSAYAEMQAELDIALIAAIKKIDNLSEDEIETLIGDWFRTQTRVSGYVIDDVQINKVGSSIEATARANVPTTLMQIAGIATVPVSVTSSVSGPATSYLDVYLVLDKSASMLLASSPTEQSKLTSALNCAFACHDGSVHTLQGIKYNTNYAYSSAKGIQLRSDVLLDSVEKVLATVQEMDPNRTRIRVGLYRLSTTTTQVLSPTFNISTVRSTLNDTTKNLTSATSTDGTHFNTALNALKPMVGAGGDGKTAGSPLKLVMMVTDGVQSQRSWVTSSDWSKCVWSATPTCPPSAESRQITPLNPAWCAPIKVTGVTFATVYTTYLPVTYDWGYNTTVGNTMASSVWSSTWGGTLRPGVSSGISRHDYLPIALEDCASSSDYFIQATNVSEVGKSLETLFKRYLSNVRLTR